MATSNPLCSKSPMTVAWWKPTCPPPCATDPTPLSPCGRRTGGLPLPTPTCPSAPRQPCSAIGTCTATDWGARLRAAGVQPQTVVDLFWTQVASPRRPLRPSRRFLPARAPLLRPIAHAQHRWAAVRHVPRVSGRHCAIRRSGDVGGGARGPRWPCTAPRPPSPAHSPPKFVLCNLCRAVARSGPRLDLRGGPVGVGAVQPVVRRPHGLLALHRAVSRCHAAAAVYVGAAGRRAGGRPARHRPFAHTHMRRPSLPALGSAATRAPPPPSYHHVISPWSSFPCARLLLGTRPRALPPCRAGAVTAPVPPCSLAHRELSASPRRRAW